MNKRKLFLCSIMLLVPLILGTIIFNLFIKEDKKEISVSKGIDKYEGYNVTKENINIPVFCYHTISDTKSDINVTVKQFRKQMKLLKDEGYYTLSVKQLCNYLLYDKPVPVKSVVITFDDGYVDNYTIAYNILEMYGLKANFFIISNKINTNGFMTKEQLLTMYNNGHSIEGHTASHKVLTKLNRQEQVEEMFDCEIELYDITNDCSLALAYPTGAYNKDTIKAIKETDYALGFTTKHGYINKGSNIKKLKRFLIDNTYEISDIKEILDKAN